MNKKEFDEWLESKIKLYLSQSRKKNESELKLYAIAHNERVYAKDYILPLRSR